MSFPLIEFLIDLPDDKLAKLRKDSINNLIKSENEKGIIEEALVNKSERQMNKCHGK